jgi:hypothetical protein
MIPNRTRPGSTGGRRRPQNARCGKLTGLAAALALLCALPALAAYEDDVGFAQLEGELGAGTPDGSGVPVGQVEAAVQIGEDFAWTPNPGNGEFTGKTITDVTGAPPGVFSNHATVVGRRFYGNTTSTSPGINDIDAYLADHWIQGGLLRLDADGLPPHTNNQPLTAGTRVSNHSWVASAGSFDEDILSRLDWVIETDDMIQVAGFTGNATTPLLSSAYNVISVNRTDDPKDPGTVAAGGIYTAGRTRPDLVAPESNASNATPRVSSAAALLVEVGNGTPGLSTDPLETSATNRNGDTVYNAERPEVVKAILMAGADRWTSNTTSADITDYRVDPADQTVNGLDRRYGAGQLNIYNSYRILAAGEQNSLEDHAPGGGLIADDGFDYDPSFGGSGGSNSTATYFLGAPAVRSRLTATLAWHLDIDGGTPNNFDPTPTLRDLDLALYDVSDPGNWVLVANSDSTNENTENLWIYLDAGKDYALQVERGVAQGPFDWDYGLAWRVTPAAPLSLGTTYPPDVGSLFQFYWWGGLAPAGGTPPYTYSIVAGFLQWNLTLNPTSGVISGVPSDGTYTANFTVQVSDANTDTATLPLQITVTDSYTCGDGCHGATGF